MIRRVALQVGVPSLLAVMACNAYLAVHHLRKTQEITSQMLESSAMRRDISQVLKDLTDMETGQRGFVLTGDDVYLQPYTEAEGRIDADLTGLRLGFAGRTEHEQSRESQLESLARSKQNEMEHSITLRRNGYRHRSFKLVGTNEGRNYMDEIRRILSSLSSAETGNSERLGMHRTAALKRALSETILANGALLVLAACLFGLSRRHGRLLEEEASQSRRELATRDLQLEKLTSALSGEARSEIVAISTTSRLLLENYGDFLPKQGHQYAEQMKDAAIQIERLRQDLVGCLASDGKGHAA